MCVYLHERVVGQAVVELACEQAEVLRAVQPQHGVQKARTTRQHHCMELWEEEEEQERIKYMNITEVISKSRLSKSLDTCGQLLSSDNSFRFKVPQHICKPSSYLQMF